jgi:hypothetical protein
MQTFLVYPEYIKSMRCLDKSRLGNQVWREGITLIRGGWPNHPASKMWRGHEYHLGLYLLAGVEILKERGKDYPEIRKKIEAEMSKHKDTGAPNWLGDDKFHASHRSNLLRKNPIWYGQFGWTESPDLPYVWPINV